MSSFTVLFFSAVAIAVVSSDMSPVEKTFFEMSMECRRKNNISDDDKTTLRNNPSMDHKCAMACVLKNIEVLKMIDGKPQLCEEAMRAFTTKMEVYSETIESGIEATTLCKAESAAVTDKCEYAAATMMCIDRELRPRSIGIDFV